MFLGEYCFKELKKEDKNRTIKTILTIFGIVFVDVIVLDFCFYVCFTSSALPLKVTAVTWAS